MCSILMAPIKGERNATLRDANLILTNPDMLHASVLPNAGVWKFFLQKLRFVVLDEAHV